MQWRICYLQRIKDSSFVRNRRFDIVNDQSQITWLLRQSLLFFTDIVLLLSDPYVLIEIDSF